MLIKNRNSYQAGFTILELTLATAIFSVILLVVATGIISFTRNYVKGVNQAQVQQTARLVMQEVTQSVQFSKALASSETNGEWVSRCLGNVKYSWNLGETVEASNHALIRSPVSGGGCTPITSAAFTPGIDTELLGKNMRLLEFAIGEPGPGGVTINMAVASGDNELFNGNNCRPGAGSEYCAITRLSTTVQPRL